MQGNVVAAEVAAEDDGARLAVRAGDLHLDEAGAQDVPRVVEARRRAGAEVDPALVGMGAQQLEDPQGVVRGVERFGLGVAGVPLLLRPGRVFLLQVRGVQEDQLGEFRRRLRAVDRRLQAVAHQAREPAAVVEVGVGQQDGVEGRHVEGRPRPVALTQFLESLEHTAVDEQLLAAGVEEVLGPRDAARGAVERQVHVRYSRGLKPARIIACTPRAVE